MALLSPPGTDPVDRVEGGQAVQVNPGWRNFFVAVFNILNGLTMSGTTAKRPVLGPNSILWVGRPYFDTTLGLPIWWDGSGWIDAQGNPA